MSVWGIQDFEGIIEAASFAFMPLCLDDLKAKCGSASDLPEGTWEEVVMYLL